MNRLLLAALLVPLTAAAAPAQVGQRKFENVVKKVEAAVEPATARRGETVTWKLTIELAPGWHTYPTAQPDAEAKTFVNKITPPKGSPLTFVGPVTEPPDPTKTAEPALGIKELHQYEGRAVWEQKAQVAADAKPGEATVEVTVTVLACDAKGCLPRQKITTKAKLTVSNDPPVRAAPPPPSPVQAAAPQAPDAPPPAEAAPPPAGDYARALAALESQTVIGERSATPRNTGLGAFLLTAALWGLVSLVTPCVFPMIPITVSFFLKQSERQQLNPLLQALVYCGTIVVVLGVAALTLLRVFRDMSVHPLTNFLLGVLFVVLALSLFGMFELTLPSALTRWSSSRESKGGLVGTVFMALTFTIVSFTCVAPFLGGFAGITASGQFRWWEMLLGALAFSGAFAAPFFLLALFPSALRKLPRSGGWLNSVKVVMGFLELAAALVFFRTAELRLPWGAQLFSYDFVLGLWVALAILCGLYLINLFRIGHDEPQESVSVPRFLAGFLFVGLGLYLLPGLFAGANGERHRPAGAVFAWVDAFLLPETNRGDLPWTTDLPRAVAEARAERARTGQRQLVFVDFTGVTCKNCKYNEKAVFSQAEVKALFRPYRLVQMYTDEVPAEFYPVKPPDRQRTAEAAANLAFQERKFGTEQLPLYVILEPEPGGAVRVVDVYDEGKINNVAEFAEFLRRPVAADTARAAR
ncbi:MAG TPA: cytochrome c biogenesis protein CcdA [Gemmataceae bacterium]|jgi:thiol:disulfide interchange protein DsbD